MKVKDDENKKKEKEKIFSSPGCWTQGWSCAALRFRGFGREEVAGGGLLRRSRLSSDSFGYPVAITNSERQVIFKSKNFIFEEN